MHRYRVTYIAVTVFPEMVTSVTDLSLEIEDPTRVVLVIETWI